MIQIIITRNKNNDDIIGNETDLNHMDVCEEDLLRIFERSEADLLRIFGCSEFIEDSFFD